MAAYYSENDPFAAAWLKELIKAGVIADGEVDERSIVDVRAADLAGFTQCHFFAGIGGWSLALRIAGFGDDRRVWTGSCPCQPFSSAGKQAGTADERHLWPDWFRLIAECAPPVVFGEQVSQAINHGWWDIVADDLEGSGYEVGAADFPACSVGAWHKRQRLYFVAERKGDGRREECAQLGRLATGDRVEGRGAGFVSGGADGGMADAQRDIGEARRVAVEPREGYGATGAGTYAESRRRCDTCGHAAGLHCNVTWRASGCQVDGCSCEWTGVLPPSEQVGLSGRAWEPGATAGELGDTSTAGLPQRVGDGRIQREEVGSSEGESVVGAGHVNLSRVLWLPCRDGKLRPTERPVESEILGMAPELSASLGYCRDESGAFYLSPLSEKSTNRVGRLRGYGNALCVEQAKTFIEAYLEAKA